jgi:hypothetical protein
VTELDPEQEFYKQVPVKFVVMVSFLIVTGGTEDEHKKLRS